ncbi:phenylacetic acid degradation protein [Thalassobacillus devorans]|uniref:Phenylacetic acid degradation protein n=1 Tax=Thalassobacillus devorans TaxID=279813 RepID=A0ABQ1PM92_9BACI|nr:hotdog fold thioesterase [Thalassobacillus devorans]NIK30235.1 acyl-CoA thioesterase [Thalassobacillus devorans]GGC99485.1 phenylacetic acid degradation protein [Thalassobacillus devorans]
MKEAIVERVSKDPYARFLGIEIDRVGEGEAEVSMRITENMMNFHGAANGGVLFSLADVAFAIASNSYGQTAVGINVNMNYMRAGMLGDKIIAAASEESKNPKLGLYRMIVRNEAGELLATADGMVYRKKEIFA